LPNANIGLLFNQAQDGDCRARDLLYRLAFHRLRSIASGLLRRERKGHTLQPTALVSEVFLKLQRVAVRILDEEHFFRLSARAMRQVLIDHSRGKVSERELRCEWVEAVIAGVAREKVQVEVAAEVRMAFEKLKTFDPVAAETVWLRAVEGHTLTQTSAAQKREIWRVRADYDFGIRWLASRISRSIPH
jgi:RNA polymerase sigma factor (TIGR02999 family)